MDRVLSKRINRAFLLFCLGPGLSVSATSQSQQTKIDWKFFGNNAMSASDLKSALSAIRIASLDSTVHRIIQRTVHERYCMDGFYRAHIDFLHCTYSKDSMTITAGVFITEGRGTTIGMLSFKGNTVFTDEELKRVIETKTGNSFYPTMLQNDIASIISLYERNGYPFVTVKVDDISLNSEIDDDRLAVALSIHEKEKFAISEITVEGNTRTDPDVIIRESRIRSGELFNADKVDNVRRRIEKLNFFSSVSEPILYRRGHTGGMKLRVEEANTNLFDGIIGYQPPRTPGESGYLIGLVHLSFRNIFGTGRKLDARWERASQDVQEIELRYLEPWIFNFPINIDGGFFQRQQDSTYVSRSLDATFSLLATDNIYVNVLGKSYAVIPSQSSASVRVTKSTTLSAGVELLIDTRDNVYYPASGVLFRNGYTGGSKSFFSQTSSESTSNYVQRLTLDISYFQQLFPKNILALSLHGREVRGGNLDVADYYRVGGAKSLRGYREEQFIGSQIAWTNLEYRYTLSKRTFAFVFFDYGYIFLPGDQSKNISEFTAWRSGYGAGIRIETALGIMALSYALGNGDSVTDGKIHFGLVNEF